MVDSAFISIGKGGGLIMNARSYNHDPNEIAEKAKKWVASSRGKRAMKEVLKKAASAKERLEKGRQIDPKSIFEPMTL
ncbi:MAG: hypothetical protein DRP28_06875 [Thermodesulfobacteriota bacterium]|nr:MAG: hypothetical protein DRP28_06875 [Thermodesulfobacteriota bacterium]